MAENEELKNLKIEDSVNVIYTKSNNYWKNKSIEKHLKKLPWIKDVSEDKAIYSNESESIDSHLDAYILDLKKLDPKNPLPSQYKTEIETTLQNGGTLFLLNIDIYKAYLMIGDEELENLKIEKKSVNVIFIKNLKNSKDENINEALKHFPWIHKIDNFETFLQKLYPLNKSKSPSKKETLENE